MDIFERKGKKLSFESKSSARKGPINFIKVCDLYEGADIVIDASSREPSVRTGNHVLRTGGTYAQGRGGRPNLDSTKLHQQFPAGVESDQ